jgi:hypothetical protein
MANCYRCGEELEFYHNGFNSVPIHPSGSCSGFGSRHAGPTSFRTDNQGHVFEFPFINYPSYVNANANCPVCGAAVYFYQSPYGGRVFFDDLGPPWPKHPCTDNSLTRQYIHDAERRAALLTRPPETVVEANEAVQDEHASIGSKQTKRKNPDWQIEGWMPFIVSKILPHAIGIEAEGILFESADSPGIPFRISQTSQDVEFRKKVGEVGFGFNLVQNSNQILSVLNECPIMLKKDPDLTGLILSSFVLGNENAIQEISLKVVGQTIG